MGCTRAVASLRALVFPLFVVAACSSQAPPRDRETVGASAQAVVSNLSLFPTGVDNSNVVLANGTADPHYSITLPTRPLRPAPPTRSAFASTLNAGWASPGTVKWISVDGTQCGGCASAVYEYTTTFSIPASANPLTAQISFSLAADDDLVLRLNGTQ